MDQGASSSENRGEVSYLPPKMGSEACDAIPEALLYTLQHASHRLCNHVFRYVRLEFEDHVPP